MNNLAFFPSQDPEHKDAPAESPDPQELQRLLGQLVGAITAHAPRRSERELRIRNFRSDRWELTDDLIVFLEERNGQYVASSYDTAQYGHGYSPDAAIHSLCSVLEDYYDLLAEDEDRLSEPLQAHLRYLRSILRERK